MKYILLLSSLLFMVGCGNQPSNDIDIPQENTDASMQTFESGVVGQTQEEIDAEIDTVKQNFIAKHPDTKDSIMFVSKIVIKSDLALYEFVTTQGVLYSNYDADFVLIGNVLVGAGDEVINISEREQLMEMLSEVSMEMEETPLQNNQTEQHPFTGLPINAGMEYIYGSGENHIVIFEDPDCQFCQNLHAQLDEWGSEVGIRATVLPYSLERHPNSLERAKALYCSDDRVNMWKKWMLDAKDETNMDEYWANWSRENNVTTTDCPQTVVVEAVQMIGNEMQISATPTILFSNGQVIEGLPDKQLLIDTLSQ